MKINKQKKICMKCNKKIKKIDIAGDYYFVVFRGFKTFRGFICLDCLDDFFQK